MSQFVTRFLLLGLLAGSVCLLGGIVRAESDSPTIPPAGQQPVNADSDAETPARPRGVTITVKPWEHYQIIYQRSMFVRQGSPRATRSNGPSLFTAPPPPPEAANWELTGIVLLANDRVAFLENMQTGITLQARVGQAVAGGAISVISGDSIVFETGSQGATIAVGRRLDGQVAAASRLTPSNPGLFGGTNVAPDSTSGATESATATTAPAATGGATPAAGGGSDSILERMRARRNQELNK